VLNSCDGGDFVHCVLVSFCVLSVSGPKSQLAAMVVAVRGWPRPLCAIGWRDDYSMWGLFVGL